MGVDNRQVGDVWAGLLPGPRQPEPAGLLTALLRAAADERRPRKKPSIPAQTQQPTSAPATGHTDVQADIAGLGVDTGGDMPSTTFTYMSLIEGLEGLYESQGLGSEGVCEQEAVCAELPGRQPLLINQWQYKHEVSLAHDCSAARTAGMRAMRCACALHLSHSFHERMFVLPPISVETIDALYYAQGCVRSMHFWCAGD